MPTLVSSADDTTAGNPQASTTASADRTPPSGATLTTTMSAASRSRTRSGSSALRMDSSAAMGTSMPLRANAIRRSRSSSTVAHGCSAYSRSWAARRPSARSASSTDHAPLASTRTLAVGPIASRTAATRARSCSSDWPASATLTLAVVHPGNRASTSATWSGRTAGTVALTGTEPRSGSGQPSQADSTAETSHRDASAGAYSRNGPNSPHPAGPSNSATSRVVTPRNGTRIGMATTWRAASRSPTGGSGIRPR